MTDTEQRSAAAKFAAEWKDKGYEKGQSQAFWLSLLRDVFGVAHPEEFIAFEEQVHLDHTSFIDGRIPMTKVLIEQKGLGKDLNRPIRQSDGSLLNPFQQAKRYITELPVSQHPRWVVTCNFAEFYVYDMESPGSEPDKIRLADLEKEYYRLQFLVDSGAPKIPPELDVSLQAGEIVGVLYDALLKQYKEPDSTETLRSLNALCVRLVFCLYAEDAGIFGRHGMFHDYLRDVPVSGIRRALVELFKVLDQKPEEREKYLADDNPCLAAFPYVNGGLFADDSIEVPPFTEELKTLLLTKASANFNWSSISPTIFGAVFESTLNPETRRSGGMHYTSVENIHKVIDPLFLAALRQELDGIKAIPVDRTRKVRLEAYQNKLAGLTFLDPACGSGNFLTETYLSLRRLENEVLALIIAATKGQVEGQIGFGDERDNPIKVSIGQFYGIEINDFAVTVARTALWIAESQMMKETEDVVHMNLDFLPLKSYANIVEGNALRLDWENVVPKDRLNYIMGNPPFVGYAYQSASQKEDLRHVEASIGKNIDYVAGWYFRAAQYMQGTNLQMAFVSTNSITQGEQVCAIWRPLYEKYRIHINFAHRTFRWDSEASLTAHVHCVIVGCSIMPIGTKKRLYTTDKVQFVDNINAYLLDAPNIFIDRRAKPLSDVPEMCKGSQPTDGGNLLLTQEEYQTIIECEPPAQTYIKPLIGAEEFLNGKKRYCLWLKGISPHQLSAMPLVRERVRAVRAFRLASKKAATRKWAEMPSLFMEDRQPNDDYIVVPRVSSERRRYIPMGFLDCGTIVTDAVQIIPNATIYEFGILTSNVHMAWMRAVCGRLKSDYRYSNTMVYNNFPWPTPPHAQKVKIEQTAQAILDARALYPDSSLADLYDELTMPPELRKAHQDNDRAVMQAYGFSVKDMTESQCVAELMKLYQKNVEGK